MMIQCPNCGTHIYEHARICSYCGFEAENPALPIAQQATFEPVPIVNVELKKWGEDESSPLFLASEDNRRLVNSLGNFNFLNAIAPDLVEIIRSFFSDRGEEAFVATFSKEVEQLIAEGKLRIQYDRQGRLLPQVIDMENHIVEKARLEAIELTPDMDMTPTLQNLQTQAAIAAVLEEVKEVERSLEQMQLELQQDRLAKADSSWNLLMQAYRVTDSRRRDALLNQVIQEVAEAKSVLMRNYAAKQHVLETESKSHKKLSAAALNAFEDLIGITNLVRVEMETYAIAGEPEAQLECLNEFRKFITDNKLDQRDTLLEINGAIDAKSKQPQLVDQIEALAQNVIQLDEAARLGKPLEMRLIDGADESDVMADDDEESDREV